MSWEDIVSKEDKAKGKLSKWCAIYGYTPLHQQVSIWPCTRPGRPDRCFSKTEGCWGVKEAINILSAWLSLSASVCTARSLSLAFHHFHLSYLTCPSLSHASSFLSLPSSTLEHSLEAANHSNKVSPLYFNPLLLPKIFISLFLSSAFASWDFRETTYKSDPGPWGVDRKTMGRFSFCFFKPTFSCLHAPNPSLLPSHLSGVCILSAQSGCYVWGSGTNMGNKLQNEMSLLMCKHSLWQHGASTHPHTLHYSMHDTYAWYTSMLQTAHSQHICKD